ncbi:MAG: serine/threonine protein kinase [Wenzhouxiangella sp.]|nr:MAG: serine/threonine protein kinase [Wenzhouxiangella sp.]
MPNNREFDYRAAIGREFGNFVVVREIGRGAMGAVFLGYQKTLKRQVAIKLLPKELARTRLAQQQFRDEAETIAILDHPNIITIFETGEDDEFFFQVMRLVDGQDLAHLLDKLQRHPVPARRLLPLQHALRLITEILSGLSHAHAAGVIHQDLKPANILIGNQDGRALIADFGIAKTMQLEYAARGMVVGTPIYLSPEQAAARDTDHRTDLYAVGVMLFELLAGRLPVRSEDARQTVLRKVREPDSFFLKKPTQCQRRITDDMESVILKAVESRPENRFQNCADFSAAVSALTNPATTGA